MSEVTKITKLFFVYMLMYSLFLSNLYSVSFFNSSDFKKNLHILSEKDSDYDRVPGFSKVKNYPDLPSISGLGSNLTVHDKIETFQYENLTLNASSNYLGNYIISPISDLPLYNLRYNITQIRGIRDFFVIEKSGGKSDAKLSYSSKIAVAQSFNVPWSHAKFYGINITLKVFYNTSLGNNALELFVVKANESGFPNMSDIRSESLINPINESNYNQLTGTFLYYDFTPSILEKGTYFVVANLSVIDNTTEDYFVWDGKVGDSFTDAYFLDGANDWQPFAANFDLSLIIDWEPSEENGEPLEFYDPKTVNLQSNSHPINSLTDSIDNTGIQTITANTSVVVEFNNTYSFYRETNATSVYSYDSVKEDTINWVVTWEIDSLNASPYSAFTRLNNIFIPQDWSTSSVTTILNASSPLSTIKESTYYEVKLNSTLSSCNFSLTTFSPNYIIDLSYESDDEDIFLGYWEIKKDFIYGYEGSNLICETRLLNNESSGIFNYSLYNPKGKINSLKENLDPKINYTDHSNYSLLGVFNSTTNSFVANITFDPSFDNSDVPGTWTLVTYWKNGTEIGFKTKQVLVKAYTMLDLKWEISEASDSWTNESIILRFSGEKLLVRSWIYSLSELNISYSYAFIQNKELIFNTSWNTNGKFNFSSVFYSAEVLLNSPAGTQLITVNFRNELFQEQIKSFQIIIRFKMGLNLLSPTEETLLLNGSYLVNITFQLINETDSNKNLINVSNEEIEVKVNDIPVTPSFYTITNYEENSTISLNVSKLGIQSGNLTTSLVFSKENFLFDYDEIEIEMNFLIVVNPNNPKPPTSPTPPITNPDYAALIYVSASISSASILFLIGYYSYVRRKNRNKVYLELYNKFIMLNSIQKALFVHRETSIAIFDYDIIGSDFQQDPSLISGFFQAISSIGEEITGKNSGSIRKIQYQNFVVTSASTDQFSIYVFSKMELSEEIDLGIQALAMWFESKFQEIAEGWNGDPAVFEKEKDEIVSTLQNILSLWIIKRLRINDVTRSFLNKYYIMKLKKYEKNDTFILEESLKKIKTFKEKGKFVFYIMRLYEDGLIEIIQE